jgi:hypothetical protein
LTYNETRRVSLFCVPFQLVFSMTRE